MFHRSKAQRVLKLVAVSSPVAASDLAVPLGSLRSEASVFHTQFSHVLVTDWGEHHAMRASKPVTTLKRYACQSIGVFSSSFAGCDKRLFFSWFLHRCRTCLQRPYTCCVIV